MPKGNRQTATERDRSKMCPAIKKTGEPCGNYKVHGGGKCMKHGGARTIQAERQKLLDKVVPDARKQLHKIITDPATSDANRVKAIAVAFNASGMSVFNNHVNVQVNNVVESPLEIIKERLALLAVTSRDAGVKLGLVDPLPITPASDHNDDQIIEAEIVSDESDAVVVEFPTPAG